MATIQFGIEDTDDEELNAIKIFDLVFGALETEARWRVLEYATKRLRASTYGSENVAEAPKS